MEDLIECSKGLMPEICLSILKNEKKFCSPSLQSEDSGIQEVKGLFIDYNDL